ncbi:MAG: hypothetical protein J6A17_03615 [Bacilli bacterium]|nr:hypothetical protein [Bacilli bacterium]
MSEKKFEFYNKNEIKKLLLNEEKLVYADNGIDEVVVRYKDLPDFIVDMSRSMGHNCNLKVYKYPIENMTPILTTIGEFLDKCDKDVRADIIERLIKVQTEEDTKNYKIIDENELEEVKEEIKKSVNVKLLNVWKSDFGDMRCNAVVSINGREKSNIIARFNLYEIENLQHPNNEIKTLIKDEWEKYVYLPKISKCSKLLQEIYDTVCNSDSKMCHIDFNDWKEQYADEYTKEDLDVLYDEIKKYKLEDIVDLNDMEYLLKDGYSTKEELKDYKPEYKIVGYGDLETCFNDDRNLSRSRDYER